MGFFDFWKPKPKSTEGNKTTDEKKTDVGKGGQNGGTRRKKRQVKKKNNKSRKH